MTATESITTGRAKLRTGVSAAAPANAAKIGVSGKGFNLVAGIILIVFAIIWLIPSLFALKTSLSDNGVAALGANSILSNWNPTLHSYASLFQAGDIWNWYLASAITSVITAVLTVMFASMAAFALSRLVFRGRNIAFLLIILGIMIPTQVLIIPIFQELNAVGLLNTYWSVIFPQVPAVIAVFIFKQFFDGIPKELEEAARIDGANIWKIYWSVILPLSRPVIAAVTILTFVGVWNNLLLPLFVLSNPDLMTIPVGLATVQGSFGQRYADIQAGAILAALPLIILYLIFQRQIVEGVTGSGLKG
ncbi:MULTISPECIES: carbohydrate ABC transporter permease [unclassified Curtobacterium]|uniref:carbohydrate ABC transporter permease n=1 Tax=unclassified Curtobacterium TaxID=257496 RepID=UPI000DAA4197|nr:MULTISPECIES: carbohydrate ABC transporter permease [unclassified Curtobacterium]ROQ04848.1 multiple sugar transport system permease protein [Curtobacterium sp. PhB171]ROQ28202.1 multiple sugar transport system permease protein [Curtobacterium sp. PhB170]ROS33266.1 multiple sugar transport system permease protein [Curtobacterium sp. PhB131]ROS58396.1 multiple sugar transport system permease protein [Curtobacterium sp. PhB172]ROS72501.1 multiple sugar transport system permease protein [Curto